MHIRGLQINIKSVMQGAAAAAISFIIKLLNNNKKPQNFEKLRNIYENSHLFFIETRFLKKNV